MELWCRILAFEPIMLLKTLNPFKEKHVISLQATKHPNIIPTAVQVLGKGVKNLAEFKPQGIQEPP